MDSTALFTHLKIILLKCFQFSVINGIQLDSYFSKSEALSKIRQFSCVVFFVALKFVALKDKAIQLCVVFFVALKFVALSLSLSLSLSQGISYITCGIYICCERVLLRNWDTISTMRPAYSFRPLAKAQLYWMKDSQIFNPNSYIIWVKPIKFSLCKNWPMGLG